MDNMFEDYFGLLNLNSSSVAAVTTPNRDARFQSTSLISNIEQSKGFIESIAGKSDFTSRDEQQQQQHSQLPVLFDEPIMKSLNSISEAKSVENIFRELQFDLDDFPTLGFGTTLA